MAGIEQTKTYGVSYTLTADDRSLNQALTTAVAAAKDLSASLTDAHAKMQTLMSGKGVTDVVNNFSKFYKDQLDKQKKGVSNILDEQAKRLQNINAKINVIGNFTGKVEALNSVARSLTRIKTLYDKTGGTVSFNINVQIGKSQTQLESLRRKAESVRTAIQKPIKIDVQTGAGRTQLGQAVKNLKSWTAELKSMGSALASQAGDKAIPVNVKPQVSPNTPPLQTSAMVTEIMNNLKTSAGTVGVEGIVNFVKAAEAVAGEIGGLSGIISFVKAAKTVVGEVGGLSGIIESVKGAKSVIGEVGGLSGIISNVKAAQSVVGEISGLTGTITSVQNAAEKILSINVEGIVSSVKTGTKTEALPLEAKLNTANINEQIKAFKPNPIAVNVQLGWGAKENSQASQIKKMSESLKPIPMSVKLDTTEAKAKLEELRTIAASMTPLNIGATVAGANKGTTQSAIQSKVEKATKQSAKSAVVSKVSASVAGLGGSSATSSPGTIGNLVSRIEKSMSDCAKIVNQSNSAAKYRNITNTRPTYSPSGAYPGGPYSGSGSTSSNFRYSGYNRNNFIGPSSASNGGLYTSLRKNLYPFTGNTSFGARTPMALEMAKGMGMMFAVSGVMQAVSNSFTQVAEYENLMKTVQAILKTNDGGGDFSGRYRAMENEIRRVGRETKFTAPEVAGAARFMAMAGLGIEDINAATNPIANLALVGDNDMSTTADKMTNIMTSFGLLKGLSASQKKTNMRHTSDVLTNTFTRSNTDLIQLAEAMQYAGPMSHLTGTSLEDAAAMVGVMGNAGIQSSMAGTTLRMMYQNIIKPNKKQAAEWDRLGIKRTDEQGRVRNIFDILQDLRAKITGTTDLNAKVGPDQLKIMGAEVMSLFRTTAGAGTAALLENLGEAINLANSNREANGVAQTIADEKKNTISGLWAQVTSTFTDQSVNTVSTFTDTIKDMLRSLRDWLASKEAAETLNSIYSMAKEVLGVIQWVAKVWKDIYSFAPELINSFIKFQFVATQIGFLVTPFVQVAGAISTLKNGLLGLVGALTSASIATNGGTIASRIGRGVAASRIGSAIATSGIGLAGATSAPAIAHISSRYAAGTTMGSVLANGMMVAPGFFPAKTAAPIAAATAIEKTYAKRVPWANANAPLFMGSKQLPGPIASRYVPYELALMAGSVPMTNHIKKMLDRSRRGMVGGVQQFNKIRNALNVPSASVTKKQAALGMLPMFFPPQFGVNALYQNNPVPSAHGSFYVPATYKTIEPANPMPFNANNGKVNAVLYGAKPKAENFLAYGYRHQVYARGAAAATTMAEQRRLQAIADTYLAASIATSVPYQRMMDSQKTAKMLANKSVMHPNMWYQGAPNGLKPTLVSGVQEHKAIGQLMQSANNTRMMGAEAWYGANMATDIAAIQSQRAERRNAIMAAAKQRHTGRAVSNAVLMRGVSQGKFGYGNALGMALQSGWMAGTFSIKSIFLKIMTMGKSLFLGLAKGLGMLFSPIGLITTAVTALGVAAYMYYDHMKKAKEQTEATSEAIKKMNQSYNSLNKDVYNYAAEKGAMRPIQIGYGMTNPTSEYSLEGNKIAETFLNDKDMGSTAIHQELSGSEYYKYLPKSIRNTFSTGKYNRQFAQNAGLIATWQQLAIESETVNEAKKAIVEAEMSGNSNKVEQVVAAFSRNASNATKFMSAMEKTEDIFNIKDPQKYNEFASAQYQYIKNFANTFKPHEYLRTGMTLASNATEGNLKDKDFMTKLATNLLLSVPQIGENGNVGNVFLRNGHVNWVKMGSYYNKDNRAFSYNDKVDIIRNIYDSLAKNEELRKSPYGNEIIKLLRTYLPNLAGLKTIYNGMSDDEKTQWYVKILKRSDISNSYLGRYAKKWLKDRGLDENGNPINEKTITPPGTDQSAYDSKYSRHQARPTQIIFNIDQLCKFENTQVNSADQKSIAETVGRQLSEGLQILFAQAASDFAIVGEANG